MVNGCACMWMLDLMCYICDITLFLYQLAQPRPAPTVFYIFQCYYDVIAIVLSL